MKTWTETVYRREGEFLGKLDDNYDYTQHYIGKNSPKYAGKKIELMKEIEKLFHEGKKLQVWYDTLLGGEVLEIGMYDGWPYWKPTPAVRLKHWHGSEVHFWDDVQSYEIIEEKNG